MSADDIPSYLIESIDYKPELDRIATAVEKLAMDHGTDLDPRDLVRELRRMVHLPEESAVPVTWKTAWREAIEEVGNIRSTYASITGCDDGES
jgi:hypothetical protein